jgi:SAM-dependent methyltransferase
MQRTMCTPQIYNAVTVTCRRRLPTAAPGRKRSHLDIGAGQGELIRRLGEAMPLQSAACDFHVERFAGGEVPIAQVDLEREPLPYPDNAFDLVTCSEVVEHLENYRALLREAHRVTKPGGLLVLTTPNVLNVQSRMRYLVSGFPVLFGPLPVGHDERHSTARHITPIPYFYLAHALLETGFSGLELDIDKVQRTSLVWLVLAAPVIAGGWLQFATRERHRLRTITAANAPHVKVHRSWRLLLGRTIVVSAVKSRD